MSTTLTSFVFFKNGTSSFSAMSTSDSEGVQGTIVFSDCAVDPDFAEKMIPANPGPSTRIPFGGTEIRHRILTRTWVVCARCQQQWKQERKTEKRGTEHTEVRHRRSDRGCKLNLKSWLVGLSETIWTPR